MGQTAINLGVVVNADGFDLSGGTTARTITIIGADITFTGSGSATMTFPSTSETLFGKDETATLTAKTLTSPVLNGTLSGTAFLDEDAMGSDSAIAAASQQSIKAYVDTATGVIPVPLDLSMHRSSLGANCFIGATAAVYLDNFYNLVGYTTTAFARSDRSTAGDSESRSIATDWAAADSVLGVVNIGGFIYVMMGDNGAPALRIYRYAEGDLTSVSQMTVTLGTLIGGTYIGTKLYSDGTFLYVSNDGGNTAAASNILEKFSISGTTLTSDSSITFGSDATIVTSLALDSLGNIYMMDASETVYLYNNAGTLQKTSTGAVGGDGSIGTVIEGAPYLSFTVVSTFIYNLTKLSVSAV